MSWQKIPPSKLVKLMWLWPPYLGAGISVQETSQDMRLLKVRMKLRWYNKNYFGTQFGGSLFSMTDPWYALMLMQNLGKGHVVVDKAADIRFRKPGTGTVTAEFKIDQALIDGVKEDLKGHGKTERTIPASIVDNQGEVIAIVNRTVWISRSK